MNKQERILTNKDGVLVWEVRIDGKPKRYAIKRADGTPLASKRSPYDAELWANGYRTALRRECQ